MLLFRKIVINLHRKGNKQQGVKHILIVRAVSSAFVALALAVFKPFGLEAWQATAYVHLLIIFLLGLTVCMLTDTVMKYVVRMPRATDRGINYVIRRNLWFQFINTPLVALMICLYRHFVLSHHEGLQVASNILSWSNFLETLVIIAFCSFAIGLYWRFKFRSKYLAAELEETRLMNEQLRKGERRVERGNLQFTISHLSNNQHLSPNPQHPNEPSALTGVLQQTFNDTSIPLSVTLTGTTSESISIQVKNLLYIESVGNYVKVIHLQDEQPHSDMLRATTKQMEDQLSGFPTIVRCHRAFLVNLQQVEHVVSRSGTMQLHIRHCNESLPVSRSNMQQVKDAIKAL